MSGLFSTSDNLVQADRGHLAVWDFQLQLYQLNGEMLCIHPFTVFLSFHTVIPATLPQMNSDRRQQEESLSSSSA